MSKLSNFEWRGEALPVAFVETMPVKDGVECDVYQFPGDNTKDLGIVRVSSGNSTPLQRVLKGLHTLEGFMSGSGVLTVINSEGVLTRYEYPHENSPAEVDVQVSETMQWHATSDLTFYEVCDPPYEDGRYENLPE